MDIADALTLMVTFGALVALMMSAKTKSNPSCALAGFEGLLHLITPSPLVGDRSVVAAHVPACGGFYMVCTNVFTMYRIPRKFGMYTFITKLVPRINPEYAAYPTETPHIAKFHSINENYDAQRRIPKQKRKFRRIYLNFHSY